MSLRVAHFDPVAVAIVVVHNGQVLADGQRQLLVVDGVEWHAGDVDPIVGRVGAMVVVMQRTVARRDAGIVVAEKGSGSRVALREEQFARQPAFVRRETVEVAVVILLRLNVRERAAWRRSERT